MHESGQNVWGCNMRTNCQVIALISGSFDLIFPMIRNVASISNIPLKAMEALYYCFLVGIISSVYLPARNGT